MQITIGFWIIPALLTVVMVFMMLRPYRKEGAYDFAGIFRIFWLIPIAVVWLVYFGLLLLLANL